MSQLETGADAVLGIFDLEELPWVFQYSDNSHKSAMELHDESRSNSPTDPMKEMKKVQLNTDTGAKDLSSSSKGKERVGSDHEVPHVVTERERRKKMKDKFSNLHALLPNFPTKADKSTIIDEAAKYIKDLEETLEQLEKQKKERIQAVMANNSIGLTSTMPMPMPMPMHGAIMDMITREAFVAEQGKNCGAVVGMKSTSSTPMSVSHRVLFSSNSFHTWTSPNVVLSVCGDVAYINICTVKKPGQLSNILCVLDRYKLEVLYAHVSSDCFRNMFMIHAQANGAQFTENMIEEIFKLVANELILLLQM